MPLPRRTLLLALPAAALALTLPSRASAGTPQIYAEDGIAMDGTDVVAYFTDARAVAGSPDITHVWRGATWRFASEENRAVFAANPEAYAPQYGGYCAYAVSEGYTAATVPEAWTIHDGKLYLNYSKRIQRRWAKDIPGRVKAADGNWPAVLD